MTIYLHFCIYLISKYSYLCILLYYVGAKFIKSRRSASSVNLKSNEHEFGAFSSPPGAFSAYDPCKCIRDFKKKVREQFKQTNMSIEAQNIQLFLKDEYASLTSFGDVVGGSESLGYAPALSKLLQMIKFCLKEYHEINMDLTINEMNSVIVRSVKSEPRLEFKFHLSIPPLVVLGTECKGAKNGFFDAIIQAFQVCADAALMFLALGIPREDISVPGIVCYGGFYQFFAVYLAPSSFPCISLLSNPLNPSHRKDRRKMAITLECLNAFIVKQISPLIGKAGMKNSEIPPTKDILLGGSGNNLFFKPVRGSVTMTSFISNSTNNLDNILSAYKELDFVPNSTECILFPIGIMCINDKSVKTTRDIVKFVYDVVASDFEGFVFPVGSPLLIFERLDSNWKNTKPPDLLRKSYLLKLEQAIEVLIKANVAHLDLRPANIMWKENKGSIDDQVQIFLIDFESIVFFGEIISPSDIMAYLKDARYPFVADSGVSEVCIASKDTYVWWIKSIDMWLNSDFEYYKDFMETCIEKVVTDKVFRFHYFLQYLYFITYRIVLNPN